MPEKQAQVSFVRGLGGNQLFAIFNSLSGNVVPVVKFFSLDIPRRRTNWEVSSFALKFASLLEAIRVGPPIKSGREIQLEFALEINNVPVALNAVKHKFTEVPASFQIEPKTYILEPFYPLTVFGGDSLSLTITFKLLGLGNLPLNNSVSWEMISPEMVMIVNQRSYSKGRTAQDAS